MSRPHTALVLGAGASCTYGFPVGAGLRQAILSLRDNLNAARDMDVSVEGLNEFLDAFRFSAMYSIDAFLGRRRAYEAIGKRAIAYVLLRCEQSANITYEESIPDHWYAYLLNVIAADDWQSLDLRWLSIVTFNYDRSIEAFLERALTHLYGVHPNEAVVKLQEVAFAHIYGSLGLPWVEGSPPWGNLESFGLPFSHWVKKGAETLVTIPEGRDDAESVRFARLQLEKAERLCFLGFGFDETNVRRLGAPDIFLKGHDTPPRLLVKATCKDMTHEEVKLASRRLFGPIQTSNEEWLRHTFLDQYCTRLLRETLILSP